MKERLLLFAIFLFLAFFVWFTEQVLKSWQVALWVTCIVAAYLAYLFVTEYFNRLRPIPVSPDFTPFCSIMVPGKNEERVIGKTIENVMAQNYFKKDGSKNFELLVIDDGSTDHTQSILELYKARYPDLKLLIRPSHYYPGKPAAVNDGLTLTTGELVLVLDADARLPEDFLKIMVPYLESPSVAAVQAKKRISNRKFNLLTRFQDNELALDKIVQRGRDLSRGGVELRGNGMLIKRKALEQIGFFTPDALTDDLDTSTKLHLAGWDVSLCDKTAVWEEGLIYWKQIFKQRNRWAEGSLRRYLSYFKDVLSSRMSLVRKFDIMIFFAEFIFPLWLFLELIYQVSHWFITGEIHLFVPAIIYGGILFTMLLPLLQGIYEEISHRPADIIKNTPLTLIYLQHWIPVVIYTSLKVLFSKGPTPWQKTDHFGVDYRPYPEPLKESSK